MIVNFERIDSMMLLRSKWLSTSSQAFCINVSIVSFITTWSRDFVNCFSRTDFLPNCMAVIKSASLQSSLRYSRALLGWLLAISRLCHKLSSVGSDVFTFFVFPSGTSKSCSPNSLAAIPNYFWFQFQFFFTVAIRLLLYSSIDIGNSFTISSFQCSLFSKGLCSRFSYFSCLNFFKFPTKLLTCSLPSKSILLFAKFILSMFRQFQSLHAERGYRSEI